jgi:hypothetical protein
MNPLHSVLPKTGTRPARLLLAGALLVLSLGQAGGAALAQDAGKTYYGRRANPEVRAARQRQQAEAMARLSPQQRQQYFAARRQLEQRFSSERLNQLQQAERCLVPARDVAAIERCQQTNRQQAMEFRRDRQRERAELQKRFNLPEWQRGGQRAGSRTDSKKGA